MSFDIPLHFEDLSRSSAGPWRVHPISLREVPPPEQLDALNAAPSQIFDVTTSPNSAFTSLYTLISHYSSLPAAHRVNLVDLCVSLIDLSPPPKLAAYFLCGLCATASATTPACKRWEKTGREAVLDALSRLVSSIPPSTPPADVDQLATLLVRTVLHVLERPSAARDRHLRPLLATLLRAALAHDHQRLPAVSALLHALSRHEHLPAPLADVVHRLGEELTDFVADFVREIARIPPEDLARDVVAAKACAAFLGELAVKMPAVFRANLALILSQLDGESYVMRNGVVHVLGVLIRAQPDPQDAVLDVLMERAFRDVNAFTRSKALQVWIALAQEKLVPSKLFSVLADLAAGRLEDKTAAVRKYAAQLLAALLQNNPFGPSLRKSHFEEKLKEFAGEDGVENNGDKSAPRAEAEEVETGTSENEGNSSGSEKEAIDRDSGDEQSDNEKENGQSDTDENQEEEIVEVELPSPKTNEDADESIPESEGEKKRHYYSCVVAFIQSVETGLETVYNMLRSKSITDVSEAVSLLITAVQFQIEAASGRAVRKMLPLVLARESNIRQATVNAYVRLLAPGGVDSLDSKESAMSVATGLAALAVSATTGELACLEALISAIFSSTETSGVISSSVIAVLWDLYAGKVPGASDEQRRAGCMLVGMIAAERPEYLQQKIHVIESIGLKDASFARWSCVALCKLPQGYDGDGQLSGQLAMLCRTSNDLSTVEQALNAIFKLSEEPELVAGSVIRDLARSLHEAASTASVPDICRFLHVIGHVAVKELVRIEGLVSQVRKSAASHGRSDGNNEEDEQASAEADKALELAEKELINPSSLLGRYGNLARKIASDTCAPPELQACAVLCMSKLMCVQEKYCETNLRLLFSILSSASDPGVRSNAVTALGDLAFRFPNLVEPWSSHIYSALQDTDDQVRKNTLMALTHLILNDMVKVKGQIVNLAICILDQNDRIADLARLFFHELARKSTNAVYNILPDTISCMSRMEDLKSDNFKVVVSFLIGLMDKEKHADGMVEKLCHRFRTNETERENRDLAYCISQLNMSERGLKKMNDAFKSFSSAICDEVVYEHIMQAINKGNRGNINATSEATEELKTKIEAIRQSAAEAEAAEEEQTDRRGSTETSLEDTELTASRRRRGSGATSDRRSTRSSARGRQRKSRERRQSVDSETVEGNDDAENSDETSSHEEPEESPSKALEKASNRRSTASTGRRRKAPVRKRVVVQETDSEDSVSDSEESSDDAASIQSDNESEASDE